MSLQRSTAAAAVIGAGPNGLAAAVTLARAGVPVTVFEAADAVGGGARTSESVMPGVLHDACASIHPLALATEFFRQFELHKRVGFVVPEVSYAHPLEASRGGAATARAALAYKDIERTANELGKDGRAYLAYYQPLMRRLEAMVDFALGPSLWRVPRDVLAVATMGARVLEQGSGLRDLRFRGVSAPALIEGVAAHSPGPSPHLAGSGVSVLLGALGHTSGWPVPVGGSRVIVDALVQDLISHGGTIVLNHRVEDVRELDAFHVKLFDTSVRALSAIAGRVMPAEYLRKLSRFRYGNAAAKVDFVLDEPIPWADPRVSTAPTVHLGGLRDEVASAANEVRRGRHPQSPYVLLTQPADFDPHRNPAGLRAVSSYTHVPNNSDVNVTDQVIRQIERFAPGFRDCVVAVKHTTAAELSRYNSNYVGGDISAGAVSVRQLLARPVLSADPHRTPARGVYLASASAAPGPGVHGLAGWYAARSALRNDYGLPEPSLAFRSR